MCEGQGRRGGLKVSRDWSRSCHGQSGYDGWRARSRRTPDETSPGQRRSTTKRIAGMGGQDGGNNMGAARVGVGVGKGAVPSTLRRAIGTRRRGDYALDAGHVRVPGREATYLYLCTWTSDTSTRPSIGRSGVGPLVRSRAGKWRHGKEAVSVPNPGAGQTSLRVRSRYVQRSSSEYWTGFGRRRPLYCHHLSPTLFLWKVFAHCAPLSRLGLEPRSSCVAKSETYEVNHEPSTRTEQD